MRRILAAAAAALLMIALVPGNATALVTPTQVITGPEDQWQPFANDTYLAWTTNSVDHPNHFDAFVRPLAGGPAQRVNARGTEGFAGNFEPGTNQLIYEQGDRRDVGIYLYDVDTRERKKAPGVNSPSAEWQPKISTAYVLFQRSIYRHGSWFIFLYLYDRQSHNTRKLGFWRDTNKSTVRTGNVGERYATYMVLNGRNWFTYLYDAKKRTTSKIPNSGGLPQYGPVVDETGGAVYFWRSGFGCGKHVKLLRLPVSLTGTPTEVAALPAGIDTGFVSSLAPDPLGGLDLYFSRIKCSASQADIYIATQVDAA